MSYHVGASQQPLVTTLGSIYTIFVGTPKKISYMEGLNLKFMLLIKSAAKGRSWEYKSLAWGCWWRGHL